MYKRQEKGVSDKSASQELKNEFNIDVTSIVNLELLVAYVKDNSSLTNHFESLNNYRKTWGV